MGTSKPFVLSVDGAPIITETMTGTTLWFRWSSATVGNGRRTLTLRVTDAAGRTATATIFVNVAN